MNQCLTIEDDLMMETAEDTTVGSIFESMETNLWLASGYAAQGAESLSAECLRSAWIEYVRFRDILAVYDSGATERIGERLVRALAELPEERTEGLALGGFGLRAGHSRILAAA